MQLGYHLLCGHELISGIDGLRLPDGLSITVNRIELRDFQAVEQRLILKNEGQQDSPILSELWDMDAFLPLPCDTDKPAGDHAGAGMARVIRMTGCVSSHNYEYCDENAAEEFGLRTEYLPLNGVVRCASLGTGKSSDGEMPFLSIAHDRGGYIVAIGWTGDWRAEIRRTGEGVCLRAGMKNAHFRLHPGEAVSTCSVLIMPYEGDFQTGCNVFRRLIAKHYSPYAGANQRPLFAYESWGGLPSAEMIRRIRAMHAHGACFEQHWIDAGWYGQEDGGGDNATSHWYWHTGDYTVNTAIHPDRLRDVAAESRAAGMGMMLWIEIERAIYDTPVVRAHPDWFFEFPHTDKQNPRRSMLLDIANDDARAWCLEQIGHYIEDLGLVCYRQDFNCNPAPVWQALDAPDRVGIHEIRHINGLYRLWDALLEKYPHLIIDNCASGGRRIDIQTLRRAIPFFRSDFQCGFNANPDVLQAHQAGISHYLPITGCSTKVKGDTYTARSAYSAAFGAGFWNACHQSMTEPELDWAADIAKEYAKVRDYFQGDYFPLGSKRYDEAAWCVSQYHLPERNEGMLIAFRRAASCLVEGVFSLNGIEEAGEYLVEDLDGEVLRIRGSALIHPGLRVCIPAPRSSKILIYRRC